VAAPDFLFAVNATFRHLHDTHGKEALVRYWQQLGHEYYRARWERWRRDGMEAIAADWRDYFDNEPGADVDVAIVEEAVQLDIRVCPAIKHLREQEREIVPCFCEHCDHVCGAMAAAAGYGFERTGGMGSCRQRFVTLSVKRETC
jgi:hypothetical protein